MASSPRDGRKFELDTIVLASGFDMMNRPHFRHVVGRAGHSIREVWDESGVSAHLGTVIPGFPSHFALLGPNTPSGNNSALQPIEARIGFAIDALRAMDTRGATAVAVRRDVMDRFDEEIQRRLAPTVWNSGGCHSWYVGADGRNFTTWPGFANEYKRRLARFDPAEFGLTSTGAASITAWSPPDSHGHCGVSRRAARPALASLLLGERNRQPSPSCACTLAASESAEAGARPEYAETTACEELRNEAFEAAHSRFHHRTRISRPRAAAPQRADLRGAHVPPRTDRRRAVRDWRRPGTSSSCSGAPAFPQHEPRTEFCEWLFDLGCRNGEVPYRVRIVMRSRHRLS